MKSARIFFGILVLLTFAGSMTAMGQSDSSAAARDSVNRHRYVQFSGAVVTADSLKPVPFANIVVVNKNRGTAANFYGFFSFVAHPGDKLRFSAQGYKDSYFTIPDTLNVDHYSLYQMMQTDTIMLTETVIYPWPNIAALEHAIVYTEIPETDYDRALRNLERQALRERGLAMPMDGSMNYRHQIQNIVDRSYYNGQYVPMTFLNPFNWAKFFKAWKEGKFKRKDD